MAGTTGRPNGRPPKPPQVRLLEGNPGHRPVPEGAIGVKPDGIPEPPGDLRAAGRRAWTLYWQHASWLTESDRSTIEEICRILDEDADMRRVLRKEGLTIRDQWPKVLTVPDTLDLLTRMFDDDEEKARLCLYQLKAIAERVGDKKSRINPLLEASHRIRQRLVPLWIEAHLTPSSRGRANIAKEVHDPLKAWEQSKTG